MNRSQNETDAPYAPKLWLRILFHLNSSVCEKWNGFMAYPSFSPAFLKSWRTRFTNSLFVVRGRFLAGVSGFVHSTKSRSRKRSCLEICIVFSDMGLDLCV